MKQFSITRAAAEPFRLVGRRPLATLIWGLVILAPAMIIVAAMVPLFAQIFSGALDPAALEPGSEAEAALSDEVMAAFLQANIWANLAQLLSYLTLLLVTTAIIRGVFAGRTGERAFFLRIGMAEVQVAVVGVAVGLGTFFILMIAAMLAVGIGFAAGEMGDPWRWLFWIALGVALLVGLILLWGRLSLLAPACIHYRTFAFEEGWKLGRGQTWRLFGLWLVLFLIALMVGLAFMVLLMIVLSAVGGGIHVTDPEAIEAWFEGVAQKPGLVAGIVVVLLIPVAWLQGFSQALFTAPFAHVVKALAADEPVAADQPPAAVVEEFH